MRIGAKTSPRLHELARIVGRLFGPLILVLVPGCSLSFNNDRHTDLAVGIPGRDYGDTFDNAGAVLFLYGSSNGLTGADDKMIQHPGGELLIGNGRFGSALAAGRFDGAGWFDLAIGIPNQNVAGASAAGAVYVVYHQAEGCLYCASNQFLYAGKAPVLDQTAQDNDHFGSALAAGKFNNDNYWDLAVGVPFRDATTPQGLRTDVGVVHILHGSSNGFTAAAGKQSWLQTNFFFGDTAEENDNFGCSLVAGDFNGDNRDDLVIGVCGETVGGVTGAGGMHVLYRSATGGLVPEPKLWHVANLGIPATAEVDDRFGGVLAVGKFNDDKFDDLAVGVPHKTVNGAAEAGAVYVLYGSSAGLVTANAQVWHQNSEVGNEAIEDEAQEDDRFGFALAAGDFNGDGRDDLAIGVPSEDVDNANAAGAVNVLYGSPSGLSAAKNQFWFQGKTDAYGTIAAAPHAGAEFGRVLAAGNFNGSPADLVVGAPYDSYAGADSRGAVHVLNGSKPDGLTAQENQYWHQGLPSLGQNDKHHDFFGSALARPKRRSP